MKQEIHPKYDVVTVRCTCGATFETRSTIEGPIQIDVCSSCHPFFTGKQKLLDTAGRIDRLNKKFGGKVVLGSQKKQKPQGPSIKALLKKAVAESKSADKKDLPKPEKPKS